MSSYQLTASKQPELEAMSVLMLQAVTQAGLWKPTHGFEEGTPTVAKQPCN